MAYELHIVRPAAKRPKRIPVKEWKEAVERVEGIRLAVDDYIEGRNPRTGEVLRIPGVFGNVEVSTEEQNAWVRVFFWHRGFVSFRAPLQYPDPVWKAAASLAALLGAEIRGDEGEAYDPATGEMI